MRRISAITAIAALVVSMALPVWASACTAMHHGMMCHRAEAAQHHHHCDMMNGQEEESSEAASQASFQATPAKCPMQCCMQAQAGNGTAVLALSLMPQLTVSEYHLDFPTVTFSRTGFSSHTDRGPPLA